MMDVPDVDDTLALKLSPASSDFDVKAQALSTYKDLTEEEAMVPRRVAMYYALLVSITLCVAMHAGDSVWLCSVMCCHADVVSVS